MSILNRCLGQMIYIALRTLLVEPNAENSILKGWILFYGQMAQIIKSKCVIEPITFCL